MGKYFGHMYVILHPGGSERYRRNESMTMANTAKDSAMMNSKVTECLAERHDDIKLYGWVGECLRGDVTLGRGGVDGCIAVGLLSECGLEQERPAGQVRLV
jgi:hypothetical protein